MPETGFDFNNLLKNRLFLQYLSAAGSSMSQGEQIAPAIGQVTHQNIAVQSYAKLLGKMLSGDVPEGAALKMSDKGMAINLPANLVKEISKLEGGTPSPSGTSMDMGVTNAPGGQADSLRNLIREQVLNPSSSQPSISGSDLAGLSPQDIASALSGSLDVQELKRKSANDVVDALFKGAQTKKLLEPETLDQPYPIGVPGIEKVTADNPHGIGYITKRDWINLPGPQKEYAAYVNYAQSLGMTKIMSFHDFVNNFEKTEREKLLLALQGDESLMETAKEIARAGRIFIDQSTKVDTAAKTAAARQKAINKLKGQTYFSNPDWVDDVEDHLNERNVSMRINLADEPDKVRAEERIRYIQSKIKGGGGKIVDVKYSADDNRIMIWTIEWPDGTKETKEYAIWD